MGCGAETEANDLMTALLAGKSFDIPDVDLTQPEFQVPDLGEIPVPVPLTNDALTTKAIGGSGTFDVIMASVLAHLKGEYEKNRITGDQYTKAYIAITEAALSNAVQFLINRDQAYYAALKAKSDALAAAADLATARVKLETSKAELQAIRYQALNQEAGYALTKLKLSTESVGYCTGQYQLTEILPAQKTMLLEQMEAYRAQTMDTRSDGITPVLGSVGKQKDLYSQQITSYQRDAEVKAAKIFTDAWITQKTIDEGLLPPTQFANASLDQILGTLKDKNGFTPPA